MNENWFWVGIIGMGLFICFILPTVHLPSPVSHKAVLMVTNLNPRTYHYSMTVENPYNNVSLQWSYTLDCEPSNLDTFVSISSDLDGVVTGPTESIDGTVTVDIQPHNTTDGELYIIFTGDQL